MAWPRRRIGSRQTGAHQHIAETAEEKEASEELNTCCAYEEPFFSIEAACSSWGSNSVPPQYRLKHTIPQTAPCSVTFVVHIVYVKGVSMWQGNVSNFKGFTVLVGTVSDLQLSLHFPFDTPTQGDISTNTNACRHQNYCFLWWQLCEPDYNNNYCKKIIVILQETAYMLVCYVSNNHISLLIL